MTTSPKSREIEGFLCIDKPSGVSSRGVVNRIQRLAKPARVGHAGTLDPMATGVLVVAVGRATRLISYIQRMQKRYLGEFELGKSSDTEDITGQVIQHPIAVPPSQAALESACKEFVGEIMQRPPAFSALRVNGRRAYKLARNGEKVKLDTRPITIHSIQLTRYEFPKWELDVACGSGTYMRSLGRDIGAALETSAVMSALRRTRIGDFSIEKAAGFDDFESLSDVAANMQPLVRAMEGVEHFTVSEQQNKDLGHGKQIVLPSEADEVAAVDASGKLLAVMSRRGSVYHPSINFAGKS